MLMKRLLPGILLLSALVFISGCATTGKSEADLSTQYGYAHDSCVRQGHRRDTYGYKRCMEKILGAKKYKLAYKKENMEETDQESEKGDKDPRDIICRRIIVTGSHMKKKVCQTRAQWEYEDKKNQKAVDEFEQEFKKGTRTQVPEGSDAMGGQSGGMPH